jgi:microcystin-dependent protein
MSCGCNKEMSVLEAKIAELSDAIDEINSNTKFLNGHPILIIEHASDIALFDFTTGKGVNDWEKWAVCDGKTHLDSKNAPVATPNFTDRFIVQAGGNYRVDDIGGQNAVALTVAELASHSHTGDNTHNHDVTDAGHDHTVTDAGHNHTQDPHTHTYDDTVYVGNAASNVGAGNTGEPVGNSTVVRTSNAATAVNNSATTGVVVDSATTGVTVDSETITLNINNTGGGEAHENRPPYYAAIYIMRIG